jgi:ABC-type nitrate/sulfonate/bicarbonate transport system substrate-binding protein
MKLTRRTFSAQLGAAAASLAAPGILRAAEPLTVGWVLSNSMHWVQCVAIEKGFYKDVGFEAKASAMQNSPHSIQMAITGGFQVATSQPEPFVAAVERGATNLGAISAPMNSADWGLIGNTSMRRLADLKGQVIGVSSLRTSESWLTSKLLLSKGFKKEEFTFIQAGLSPAKVSALQKGALGAAILYQPAVELAIKEGLPLLARYGTMRSYPTILYVVNREWAAKGDSGKRVSQAIQRSHAWLWDPQNKDEAIRILAKYTKRETDVLDAVYQEYFVRDKIYGRRGEIELDGLQRALDDMAQDGEIFKTAPPAKKFVLDPSLGAILA